MGACGMVGSKLSDWVERRDLEQISVSSKNRRNTMRSLRRIIPVSTCHLWGDRDESKGWEKKNGPEGCRMWVTQAHAPSWRSQTKGKMKVARVRLVNVWSTCMQVLEVLGWSKGFPKRWQCGCSFNIMRVRDRGQRCSHREELADQSLRRRSPDVFSKGWSEATTGCQVQDSGTLLYS